MSCVVCLFQICLPQASLEVLDDETTQLWWAGKELLKGKQLLDYVGKNEKTKIVAKIQQVSLYPIAPLTHHSTEGVLVGVERERCSLKGASL